MGWRALVSSFAILVGCAADADALPLEAAGSTGTSTGGSTAAIAESSSTHGVDASSGSVLPGDFVAGGPGSAISAHHRCPRFS